MGRAGVEAELFVELRDAVRGKDPVAIDATALRLFESWRKASGAARHRAGKIFAHSRGHGVGKL